MVNISDLHLVLEGNMTDSSIEALDRLKDALNGGYGMYCQGSKVLIFEEEDE